MRGSRFLAGSAVLLVDDATSFTWNLVHYLGELGAEPEVVRNDKISVDDALDREPEAIVLSPGPCTPNEAGICLQRSAAATGAVPIFGVCLGHQAIGQAYGGEVVRAPKLMRTASCQKSATRATACSTASTGPSRRRAIIR